MKSEDVDYLLEHWKWLFKHQNETINTLTELIAAQNSIIKTLKEQLVKATLR